MYLVKGEGSGLGDRGKSIAKSRYVVLRRMTASDVFAAVVNYTKPCKFLGFEIRLAFKKDFNSSVSSI